MTSYPSDSPQSHDPVCKYQGESHPFGYGSLSRTSTSSHWLRHFWARAPLFLAFWPSPVRYSNPPARHRRAKGRWQSREVLGISRMGTSSLYPLRERITKSISLGGSQAPDVRIPGVTATLHTITAIMFTSRLSGVRTCNLHTRSVRSCRESSEPSLFRLR